jgi:hypothetical protein
MPFSEPGVDDHSLIGLIAVVVKGSSAFLFAQLAITRKRLFKARTFFTLQ